MIGCGHKLLEEIREVHSDASQELNYTNEFPDGSVVKAETEIVISGTTVTVCCIFTGHGQLYEDSMEKMKREVLTGEFQADFKKNYSSYKPENICTDIKATVIQLPTASNII